MPVKVAIVIAHEKFDRIRNAYNLGYVDTIDKIEEIARIFEAKYANTDWEQLLYPEGDEQQEFPPSVMCWDEAILYFTEKFIEYDNT